MPLTCSTRQSRRCGDTASEPASLSTGCFSRRLISPTSSAVGAASCAELLEAYPGLSPQRLDNGLTTAKRAFRRFVEEVMPRGLRDEDQPADRFDEWMAILRDSNASQFNLLHLAYRVMPFLALT